MRKSRRERFKRAKSRKMERTNSNLETRLRSIEEEGCDEDSNDDNSCSSSVLTQKASNEKIKIDKSAGSSVRKTEVPTTQGITG